MNEILPLLIITATSLLMLLTESLVKKSEKFTFGIALIGISAATISAFGELGTSGLVFHGMLTSGGVGSYVSVLVLLSALWTVVLSRDYLIKTGTNYGEFQVLIVFAVTGMMLIAQAADLIIIFLGIELMSICLYVLAGFTRKRMRANEASLKYFLLGAFATGFLLYGIALIYGAAGTTSLPAILGKYTSLELSTIFWCGIALLLVGLAFKVGAFPFHMWIPDVYQGSPTPVSGFMATGAKAAAFSALILVFAFHHDDAGGLTLALALLAAASMVLGNVVAIAQSNVKRMLAYSSIAHAGYMLVGLSAGNSMGKTGVLFYLASYLFMNIGAFGVLSIMEDNAEGNLTFEDYAGLGSRKPLLAAMMAMFMFSLAGIPPFAGFVGKYYMFLAAINAHMTWLAIVGVVTSMISVYYYLRLVMMMYFQEPLVSFSPKEALMSRVFLVVAALTTLFLGVYPSSLLDLLTTIF